MMRKKNVLEVKKWETSNGNVCFSVPMRDARLWIIMSAALIAIVAYCILYFIFGKCILFVPIVFGIFLLSLWLIDGIVGGNDAIITEMVLQIMNNAVDEDVKEVGAKVVRKLVNHDTKGTYGIIESSCLLVLLDNGEVWEYPLVYHKTEEAGIYCECDRNHVVSKNRQHIRKINPKRWNHFIERFKLSEKTRLGLLLATLLAVGGLVFVACSYFLIHFKWRYLLILFSYVGLYCFVKWLAVRMVNRTIAVIKTVISIPFTLFYLFFHTITPFITIVGTYFVVGLFTFLFPAAVLFLFAYFGLFELKFRTIIFLVFTVGSILCTHFYGITKWMIRFSPLRDWGNHTYESYREQLAIYLIHPSNVMFLLYLLYFVFLGISGYLQIEKDRYLITQGIDAAILKAFLVFIAFTNMRVKAKDAELDIRELYHRTLKLFVHDA